MTKKTRAGAAAVFDSTRTRRAARRVFDEARRATRCAILDSERGGGGVGTEETSARAYRSCGWTRGVLCQRCCCTTRCTTRAHRERRKSLSRLKRRRRSRDRFLRHGVCHTVWVFPRVASQREETKPPGDGMRSRCTLAFFSQVYVAIYDESPSEHLDSCCVQVLHASLTPLPRCRFGIFRIEFRESGL